MNTHKMYCNVRQLAFPADFAGLEMRCLECWMKFMVGLDVTVKGSRVEPNSEWKWSECDLMFVGVFVFVF